MLCTDASQVRSHGTEGRRWGSPLPSLISLPPPSLLHLPWETRDQKQNPKHQVKPGPFWAPPQGGAWLTAEKRFGGGDAWRGTPARWETPEAKPSSHKSLPPSERQHQSIKVLQAKNLLLVVFLAESPPLYINQPRLFQHGSHREVDLFGSNTGSFQINTNCSPKLLNSLNCSPLFGNHLRQFNKKPASERQLQIDKVFETRLISLLSGKFIHLKQNEEDKQPCWVRKTPPATELLNFLFQRCSYYLERATTLLKQGSRLQCL